MRQVLLTVALFMLAVSCACGQQSGGCAFTTNYNVVSCPPSCGGTVNENFPISGYPNETWYNAEPVYCCNRFVGVNFVDEGICVHGLLRDPTIRERLLELAKTYSITVSDCTGKFLPIEAAITKEPLPELRGRPLWKEHQ